MNIVVFGGTGQVGGLIERGFGADSITVVSRSGKHPRLRCVQWDGKTVADWARLVDGCDVVINLAGRSVNCRYTAQNLLQMLNSRVESTRVVGQAIAAADVPPKVWLQMSTATIYAHRFDADNDEHTGRMGGDEPDADAGWARSVEIAQAWEAALWEAPTEATRKIALRTSMVMSPDRGGIFDTLRTITRRRLGGAIAGGSQYMSWIHEHDFTRALRFIIEDERIRGPVNLASTQPLSQRQFMRELAEAMGIRVRLPATAWMASVGAWVLGTETELLFKSRRVRPGVLLEHGFEFVFPNWTDAVAELIGRDPIDP